MKERTQENVQTEDSYKEAGAVVLQMTRLTRTLLPQAVRRGCSPEGIRCPADIAPFCPQEANLEPGPCETAQLWLRGNVWATEDVMGSLGRNVGVELCRSGG